MPRPSLPPTPSSSTDITGKDGVSQISSLQLAFELPPPAIVNQDISTDRQTQSKGPSTQQYPMQAAEAVKSRRRASTLKDAQKDAFTLPPPPTRTRKIIQMKPRGQDMSKAEKAAAAKEAAASKTASAATASASSNPDDATAASDAAGASASKKKQASATSTAGRKQARKTAHSLIERRRRSKMNEEFAVLKGMIPACTGEMHKLAILQASIEYVRYLEDCVAKLKAQHEANAERSIGSAPGTPIAAFNLQQQPQQHHHDESGTYLNTNIDIDMADSDNSPSPTTLNAPPSVHSHHSSVSPALRPNDMRNRHDSYSSVSTDYQRYGYTSATTSPAFGPQHYTGYAALPGSALTSPALQPQRDLDQEATAALLMLNSDRRGLEPRPSVDHGQAGAAATGASARGMSVRDLLSS